MEITIKPKKVRCQERWDSKMMGVVLVEKKEDIDPLFKLLCDQDDYWEHYKKVIQVAPKEIDGIEELEKICVYVGKTDIYDIEKIKEHVQFILFQREQTDRD